MESNINRIIKVLKLWELYSNNKILINLINYIVFTYKKILYENNYIKSKLLLNNINIYIKNHEESNEEINFVLNYVIKYNDIILKYILLEYYF